MRGITIFEAIQRENIAREIISNYLNNMHFYQRPEYWLALKEWLAAQPTECSMLAVRYPDNNELVSMLLSVGTEPPRPRLAYLYALISLWENSNTFNALKSSIIQKCQEHIIQQLNRFDIHDPTIKELADTLERRIGRNWRYYLPEIPSQTCAQTQRELHTVLGFSTYQRAKSC